ncbi:MAG: hypothetical protein ACC618_02490 [Patescibacteria group bacterium]
MADQLIIEEQHPIPQQISSFQFRLVGDMTLKQFLQLAGGAVIALIIYSTNLPPAIKWPLVFISFGFGAALAFLPLEDRPLAKWIFSFFKSIYSPTIFIWQKSATPQQFFAPEPTLAEKPPGGAAPTQPAAPVPAGKMIVQRPPEEHKLEEGEKRFLTKITQMSDTTTAGAALGLPKTMPAQKTQVAPKKAKTQVFIPQKGKVAIPKSKRAKTIGPGPDEPPPVSGRPTPVSPVYRKGQKITGAQAKFSPEAAPPIPPTRANILVGQVVDPDGKIVEAAILEIKDDQSRPVRALKTNKLGHFMIVTSLLNGKYEIVTEKEGLKFDPVTFEARGEVVAPIAIWAKDFDDITTS